MSELRTARFVNSLREFVTGPYVVGRPRPQLRTARKHLRHARQHPGEERTNVGGWHSETGVLEFCGDAGKRLIHHIHEMTEEATRRLYAEFYRPPEF